MANQKNALIFYWEWADIYFKDMAAEEAKSLLLAIVDSDRNGVDPADMQNRSGVFRMAYKSMVSGLRRNREKYEETCRKRAEAAKARWLKDNPGKTPTDYEKEVLKINGVSSKYANACENESDSEYESDFEKENERDFEKDIDLERDKEKEKGKGEGKTIGENHLGKPQKMYGYWSEEDIKDMCNEKRKPFNKLSEHMKEEIGKAHTADEAKKKLLEFE